MRYRRQRGFLWGGDEGFLDQERNRGKERDGRGSECLREEDQAVRLEKMRVERHRSDPRCGDDPVDPDAAEPVAVEQSISGPQAAAGRLPRGRALFAWQKCADRSVCLRPASRELQNRAPRNHRPSTKAGEAHRVVSLPRPKDSSGEPLYRRRTIPTGEASTPARSRPTRRRKCFRHARSRRRAGGRTCRRPIGWRRRGSCPPLWR